MTEILTESIKLAFETFKQLATLNAGSIVLIGTFLQGIFPSQNGALYVGLGIKLLIAASFLSFGVSLALSAYTMYLYTRILENYLKASNELDRTTNIRLGAQRLPLALFWYGIASFGVAVLLNLFR